MADVIRNMTGTLRNRHDGATQVQRHETDPGEPPRRLRAPGMHRVPSGDLLSNAVEDLGGGGALCRRAENLRPIRDKVARRPWRLFARWRLTPGQAGPVVEKLVKEMLFSFASWVGPVRNKATQETRLVAISCVALFVPDPRHDANENNISFTIPSPAAVL